MQLPQQNRIHLSMRIEGELFEFYGNIQEILTKTENIQGFRSFGDPNNYFRITCTYIDTGDNSKELAWVYAFDGSLGSAVSKNDWRLHTCTLYEALDAIIDDFDKVVPNLNKILLPTGNKSEIFDPVELLAKEEITERQLQYWTGFKMGALDFNLHNEFT